MKIAVNTRLLIENDLEGIGRFSYEILKNMASNNPDIQFDFIFDRPYSKKFLFNDNVTGHVLSPKTRHPFLWYYWFEIKLPKLLKKLNPDVLLSTDGFIPLNFKIKKIAVIHDINFEHYPENLPFFHRKYYQFFFPKYAKLCDKIITVSNYSKEDISNKYNISKNKISVIYNGVSELFFPINNIEKTKIKNQFSSGFDYFIFIGSIHKRKNITNLLKGYELFKKRTKSETRLLIVGKKRWWSNKMKITYENMVFKNDVLFTGYIKENMLPKVLGSAKGLCLISLFEGFGLPIIEAMKCGVPVITSNKSSMPEICDNAGITVSPDNIFEISMAIQKIDTDKLLRTKLIELGYKRAKLFNWQKASHEMLKIIRS